MARKSKMARAGKAAHNAWKDQQKQVAAQQESLEKAKTARLLLSEFLPPVFAQGLDEDAGQDMATIAKVSNSSFTRSTYQYSGSRLSYALWPYRLGCENLKQFRHFWETRLAETEAKAQELERTKASEELFNTQVSIERIKASVNYLTALIDMERPGMPVLPIYRQKNHFRPNDQVWCFVATGKDSRKQCQYTFVRGTVTAVTLYNIATVRLRIGANVTCYATTCMLMLRDDEYQQLLADSFLSGEWLRLATIAEDQTSLNWPMYEALRQNQLQLEVGDYEYIAAVRENAKKGKI